MKRVFSTLIIVMMGLSACGAPSTQQIVPDGKPLPKVNNIRQGQTAKIQFSMLDTVNNLRSAAGDATLELDDQLNAAAATHAQDMS